MDSPLAKRLKLGNKIAEHQSSKSNSPLNGDSLSEISSPKEESDKSKPVLECDVGITEYISDHEGFQGIIKQRYSDFLVNEINMEGEIVRLTDIDMPSCDEAQKNEDRSCPSVLTDEQLDNLKLLSKGATKDSQVLIEVGEDKQNRSKIHQVIREQFPSLISQTENINNTKYIVVTRSGCHGGSDSSAGWKRQNRQQPWTQKENYCYCVLYKENKDTMFAINLLAKYLRLRPNMITYAGTKDKRAKTCQLISFYRVTASRLYALNKKLREMVLGNFSYRKEPLSLGDLKGNHFVIILRSVTASETQLQQAMSSLKTCGFINYFGMQRFGTTSIPTHLVGRALLRGCWQEAIDLILKPRHSGADPIYEVRNCWSTEHDAAKALKLLGNRTCPERHLLNGLKNKDQNDYVGALGCIPRNNRLIYIHAYQSFLWNRLTSARIKQFGLKPTVGDLVICADVVTDTSEDVLDDVTITASQKKAFVEPTIVTEENIHMYTIHDVVLPLAGYDVIYPENELGELYKTWLATDGLLQDDLKHKVKDYSLRGAYRHVVVCPKDLAWQVILYDDPNIPLILSDLEKLNGEKLTVEENKEGTFKALKLEFTLPPSTYATMALREVLKQDTSAGHQTSLTSAAMEDSNNSETVANVNVEVEIDSTVT